MWGTSGAVAPNQRQVGWLTKGESPLQGGDSKAQESIFRDELHFQRPAVKEGLGNGMERVGVQHMGMAEEEDVVHIACSKNQACSVAPRRGWKGTKKTVLPEEGDRAA